MQKNWNLDHLAVVLVTIRSKLHKSFHNQPVDNNRPFVELLEHENKQKLQKQKFCENAQEVEP